MKVIVVIINLFAVVNAFNRILHVQKRSKISMLLNPHELIDPLINFHQHFHPALLDLQNSFILSDEDISTLTTNVIEASKTATQIQMDAVQAQNAAVAAGEVSRYSVVDKTGFIGFIADNVENAIDFGHDLIKNIGVKNSYGFSIILFTFFGK